MVLFCLRPYLHVLMTALAILKDVLTTIFVSGFLAGGGWVDGEGVEGDFLCKGGDEYNVCGGCLKM